MPLPTFLVLLAAVLVAATLTIWAASVAGIPVAVLALTVLLAAGVVRMMTRVE